MVKKFSKKEGEKVKKVKAEKVKEEKVNIELDDDSFSALIESAKDSVPDVFVPESGSIFEVSDWISMPDPICEVLGDLPGLPCGHIVEVLGLSDCGKTSICTHALIGAQQDGGVAVLIDSEHKFNLERAKAMGLNPDRLVVIPIETIEEAFDRFTAMIKVIRASENWVKRKVVFCWDSVGSTPSENELDEKTKDHAMLAAKALKAGLRRIRFFLRKTNASLLLINQVYEKQTKTAWEKKTRGYGGHGPEYFSSIRLECKRVGKISKRRKIAGKDQVLVFGIQTEVECIKNHMAAPFRKVLIGIDRKGIIVNRDMEM